jgi:hypothetical protein
MAIEEKDMHRRSEGEVAKPIGASGDREPGGEFEKAMEGWEREMHAEFEANRAAERLSADDFAIRINA